MGPIHHVFFDVIELERWFLAWQPCPEVEIGGDCRDSVVWRYYADPCKDSQWSVVSQVRFDKVHVNDAVSTNPFGCFVGVGSASDWCEVGNHWVVRMCFASSDDSSWETRNSSCF
jgi:hypothetical protein